MIRLAGLCLVIVVGASALAGQGDTTRPAPRLFRIEVNQRSGYIDATGRTVIAPRFEESGRFAEGLAPARVEGKWGFIDTKGSFVIAPQFAQASGFAQGLVPVSADGKWGYIDRTGAWVIRPQFFGAPMTSPVVWLRWRRPAHPTRMPTAGGRLVTPTSGDTSTPLAGS